MENEIKKETILSDEVLQEIKEAAREGAKEGAKEGSKGKRGGGFLAGIFGSMLGKGLFAVIVLAMIAGGFSLLNPTGFLRAQFASLGSAKDHDMVLEDNSFLGYTAVDFAEAILGDSEKLCKIEVLKQEVSDVATITDAGLGAFKIFSKTQLITYHGTAVFTVDLSRLSQNDFVLDEEEKTLTVYIPECEMEDINIQSSDIEFGDVNKGMLAFGDIKTTPQQMAEIQTMAQEMMQQKIEAENVKEEADRFAKLAVWELYQPIVNSVTKGYSLKVEIRENESSEADSTEVQ